MNDLVDDVEKNKVGAPGLYKNEYNEQAYKLMFARSYRCRVRQFF